MACSNSWPVSTEVNGPSSWPEPPSLRCPSSRSSSSRKRRSSRELTRRYRRSDSFEREVVDPEVERDGSAFQRYDFEVDADERRRRERGRRSPASLRQVCPSDAGTSPSGTENEIFLEVIVAIDGARSSFGSGRGGRGLHLDRQGTRT